MSSMNNFREKILHWSLFVNWSFWGWRSQGGGNCIKWIRFNLDRIIWIRCDQLKKKLPSLWRWGEENPPWALQDSNDNYLRAKANINNCRTMAQSYFLSLLFLGNVTLSSYTDIPSGKIVASTGIWTRDLPTCLISSGCISLPSLRYFHLLLAYLSLSLNGSICPQRDLVVVVTS